MTTCQWYAHCDNDALGTVPHPILGQVPTCVRCADIHGLQIERYRCTCDRDTLADNMATPGCPVHDPGALTPDNPATIPEVCWFCEYLSDGIEGTNEEGALLNCPKCGRQWDPWRILEHPERWERVQKALGIAPDAITPDACSIVQSSADTRQCIHDT